MTAAQRPAAILLHRPFWYSAERPDGQSAPVFLASNTVLGKLFSSENILFIHLWEKKYMILYHYVRNTVNIGI